MLADRLRLAAGEAGDGDGTPSTDSEVSVLEADTIEGKSDGNTVATGDWTDHLGREPTLSGCSFKTNMVNGHPAVRLAHSTPFNLQHGSGANPNTVAADDTYSLLLVFQLHSAPADSDFIFRGIGDASQDLELQWFSSSSKWRLAGQGDSLAFTETFGDAGFTSGFGLLEIDIDRAPHEFLYHEGNPLAMFSEHVSTFTQMTLGEGSTPMDVAAAIILKNPSASDRSSWETYLTEKYDVTGRPDPGVEIVSATEETYGSGDSITTVSRDVPTAVEADDLIVAVLMQRAGASAITAPSGFTRVAQQVNAGGYQWGEVWTKTADGTEGGTTLTFTGGSSGRMALLLMVLRRDGSTVSLEDSATNTTETLSSVTSGGAGRILLGIVQCGLAQTSGTTTFEFPVGWIQLTEASRPASPSHERNRLCVAVQAVGSGATGTTAVTHSASSHSAGALSLVFAP